MIRYLNVVGVGVLSSCEGAEFDVWRSLIVFFEGGIRLRQRNRCVSIVDRVSLVDQSGYLCDLSFFEHIRRKYGNNWLFW